MASSENLSMEGHSSPAGILLLKVPGDRIPATGGGGSLMDMGSHCIDLLEMFFGKIKSVSCFINNSVHAYKSEDSAVVSILFENGAMGTVDTYFCIPDNSSKNILELYGSKGSILAKGNYRTGSSRRNDCIP